MRGWTRWQTWTSLLAGAWLFFSPWILGFTGTTGAAWNAWILGAVVFLASVGAHLRPASRSISWSLAILGAWTVAAPWVLAFASVTVPAWNAWVLGAIVFILALWVMGRVGERRGAAQHA